MSVIIMSAFCTVIVSQSSHALSLSGLLPSTTLPLVQINTNQTLAPLTTILTSPLKAVAPSIVAPVLTIKPQVAPSQPVLQVAPTLTKPVVPKRPAAVRRTAPAQKKSTSPAVAVVSNKSFDSESVPTSASFLNIDPDRVYLASVAFPLRIDFGNSVWMTTHPGSNSSFKFLQATNEGWKLLGVLWCWWVIAIAAIYAAIFGRKEIIQYFFNKRGGRIEPA